MRALLALALLIGAPAFGQDNRTPSPYANVQLPDPGQEAAARALMLELRCLVCQGQSIADSDVALAGDMRSLVRERIHRGERPAAIRQWLIDRYGDYVTYDPPFAPVTALLWLAPILFLLLGAGIARASFKRRPAVPPPTA